MRRVLIACCLAGTTTGVALAQNTPAGPSADAADIASGWSAFASGDTLNAAAIATTALGRYPWSVAAAQLLIEVETLRSGADAGLLTYERWLGSRQLEAPYLLRPVARSVLRAAARSGAGGNIRTEAVRALILDGDTEIAQEAQAAAAGGSLPELSIRGSQGDETATRTLIANLEEMPGDRSIAIGALARTGNALAVQPLVTMLADPLPANRTAAADALGDLSAKNAVGALRQRLQDENFTVRFAAARALVRLGDGSGLGLLKELERSDSPLLRAQTLEAMSTNADAAWVDSVRSLLGEADPDVRLLAASIIAPHDQAAAVAAIQPLLQDPNLAIREEASRLFVDKFVMNAGSLRGFLRSPDLLVKVRAAARLLELTR